jgi:hypothetical protein
MFEMGPGYDAAPGVRAVLSGTPPILAMVPLLAGVELLEEAGIAAVRAKSELLTAYAVDSAEAWLVPLGFGIASPRDPERRGGHVTLCRSDARELNARLVDRGVIPDFRAPDGLRLGLAPLSTSFAEVRRGLEVLREVAGQLTRTVHRPAPSVSERCGGTRRGRRRGCRTLPRSRCPARTPSGPTRSPRRGGARRCDGCCATCTRTGCRC